MDSALSIRRRLLIWIGLPFTALAFLALLSSYLLLSRQINESFDDLLLNAAKRLEQRIYTVDGELHINMHYFSVSTLGSRGEGKIFYRVREVDGAMIAGFSGLEPPEDMALSAPVFFDVDYAGNQLRAVALTSPLVRGRQRTNLEVVVAESQETRQSLANDFMVTLTGLMLVTGLLAISLALLAIHKGLAPLSAISQALTQRSPHDLHSLDVKAPREILPLIQSINHLMDRMRRSIDSTQQLNADVSHQLRTPISEIRALAERAQKQHYVPHDHTRFLEIQRIAEQAGRTVQQLLKYAKTRSELIDTDHLETVDLGVICRDACTQTATGIYQQGQELAFEQKGEAAKVLGDPITLLWLIVNLIENASIHAGGDRPYQGTITVGLDVCGSEVALTVSDAGQGVDEAYLDRLTERFYRYNDAQPGSGLGLAIVEQIAMAHSATLTLSNRKPSGFEVRVVFAMLKPSDAPNEPSEAS